MDFCERLPISAKSKQVLKVCMAMVEKLAAAESLEKQREALDAIRFSEQRFGDCSQP